MSLIKTTIRLQIAYLSLFRQPFKHWVTLLLLLRAIRVRNDISEILGMLDYIDGE
jgi:hypothetical protein